MLLATEEASADLGEAGLSVRRFRLAAPARRCLVLHLFQGGHFLGLPVVLFNLTHLLRQICDSLARTCSLECDGELGGV